MEGGAAGRFARRAEVRVGLQGLQALHAARAAGSHVVEHAPEELLPAPEQLADGGHSEPGALEGHGGVEQLRAAHQKWYDANRK